MSDPKEALERLRDLVAKYETVGGGVLRWNHWARSDIDTGLHALSALISDRDRLEGEVGRLGLALEITRMQRNSQRMEAEHQGKMRLVAEAKLTALVEAANLAAWRLNYAATIMRRDPATTALAPSLDEASADLKEALAHHSAPVDAKPEQRTLVVTYSDDGVVVSIDHRMGPDAWIKARAGMEAAYAELGRQLREQASCPARPTMDPAPPTTPTSAPVPAPVPAEEGGEPKPEVREKLRGAWMRVQAAKRSGDVDFQPLWDVVNMVPAVLYELDHMAEFERAAAGEDAEDQAPQDVAVLVEGGQRSNGLAEALAVAEAEHAHWIKEATRHKRPGGYRSDHEQHDLERARIAQRIAEKIKALRASPISHGEPNTPADNNHKALVEALRPFAEAAKQLRPDDADTMRPAAVQAIHYRRAAEVLAALSSSIQPQGEERS